MKKEEIKEMPELPPKCEECDAIGQRKLYFNDEYIYLCEEHYRKAITPLNNKQ